MLRLSKKDERGSLAIAIPIMMVLVLLSTALMARTVGSISAARKNQDTANSLAGADEGISAAIYNIDQEPTASFTGSGTTNGNPYEYKATYIDQNTWLVHGRGTVSGTKHAAEVTVSRTVEFPYAIFSEQQIRFNGNGGPNISSYNSNTHANNTHHAAIGSNHAIVINGGGGGDEQDYFTPNGSCSGCSNGVQKPGPMSKPDPIAPTSGFQACPANGVFGPIINGQSGTPFVCNQDISFASGDVTITNGPAEIYVTANHQVSMSDTNINPNGSATNFLLFKAGTGAINFGSGSHAPNVNGVVYAPSSSLTVNGGQFSINGSLTLNSLTINGNPNFSLTYDDALMTLSSTGWSQSNWHEIASTAF